MVVAAFHLEKNNFGGHHVLLTVGRRHLLHVQSQYQTHRLDNQTQINDPQGRFSGDIGIVRHKI
jgi:hypothetical protein